jgi:hypothetical protein
MLEITDSLKLAPRVFEEQDENYLESLKGPTKI